jgi:hypothetical protein
MLMIGFIVAISINCNKTSGVDIFIPNLSNTWLNTANDDVFFFKDYQENVNESDFNGFDNLNGNLTGHFKNYDIHFTFSEGAEQGVTYTGQFLKEDPSIMKLKDDNGNEITLERNE